MQALEGCDGDQCRAFEFALPVVAVTQKMATYDAY